MYGLIKKMVCCSAVSGREKNIADAIRGEISPFVDEISVDALGNLIALKKGTAPEGERKRVLFCAHADEIGFIVTFIESSGLIRFAPIGGINFIAAAFSEIVFENGTRGILVPDSGVKGDALTFDKCAVDIGAASAKEAEHRVSVGDCFSLVQHTTRLGKNRVSGRPLDDRVGCAVLIKTAEMLREGTRDDIYYVFSVQEEVGCRGARTAGFAVAPDVAIAVDVTATGDTAGSKPMAVRLGDGAAVKIKDSSVICDPELVEALFAAAEAGKIACQTEVLVAGGTDTSSLQMAGAGCSAGAISIPTRYIHTGVEMIDLRDAEACAALCAEYVKRR